MAYCWDCDTHHCDRCNHEMEVKYGHCWATYTVCPQCDGFVGLLRRLFGRVDVRPPHRDLREVWA